MPEPQPLPRSEHADQRSRVHPRPLGGVQVVEAAPLPRQAGPHSWPLLMDQAGSNMAEEMDGDYEKRDSAKILDQEMYYLFIFQLKSLLKK